MTNGKVITSRKAVNAATKACKQQSGGGSSSIANDAFVTALAVTKAVCDQEHWYQDTEDSEPCTAAAKKLSKLWWEPARSPAAPAICCTPLALHSYDWRWPSRCPGASVIYFPAPFLHSH